MDESAVGLGDETVHEVEDFSAKEVTFWAIYDLDRFFDLIIKKLVCFFIKFAPVSSFSLLYLS